MIYHVSIIPSWSAHRLMTFYQYEYQKVIFWPVWGKKCDKYSCPVDQYQYDDHIWMTSKVEKGAFYQDESIIADSSLHFS